MCIWIGNHVFPCRHKQTVFPLALDMRHILSRIFFLFYLQNCFGGNARRYFNCVFACLTSDLKCWEQPSASGCRWLPLGGKLARSCDFVSGLVVQNHLEVMESVHESIHLLWLLAENFNLQKSYMHLWQRINVVLENINRYRPDEG